jgi:sugar phosphate permease
MPILAVLYAFSHLDRSNIGSARVDGMDADLSLAGNNSFSVALLVFFISYFLFELPSNVVLRKIGPPIWLSFLATGWGVIMLCMGFVQNAAALAGCRFLLGLFEAGCTIH